MLWAYSSLFAQQNKKSRILFLLDASSSMTYNWNAKYSRYEVASNILLKIIDSIYAINPEVEFALRTYGTQKPAAEKNCTDTKLEVPFNIQNALQIKTRLQNISAYGYSPIAYSLKQAAENEISNIQYYDYSIIFITDGGESCDGDVCKTFQDYILRKIKLKPYIIGLDVNVQLNQLYDCMGNYIAVSDSTDVDKAVKMIVEGNRPILDKPKSMNITPVFTKPQILKDSTNNIEKPKITPPIAKVNRKEMISLIYKNFKPQITDKLFVKAPIKKLDRETVTIKYNIEEEKIKPQVVEVKRITNIIPYLKVSPYVLTYNKLQIKKQSELLYPKNTTVKITINTEEPPPPIVKKQNILPFLKLIPYTNSPIKAQLKKQSELLYPKNTTVKITINTEEPPPPIVKKQNVIPYLVVSKYNIKKFKLNLEAVTKTVPKLNTKIAFDWEEPVVRKNNILPRLNPINYSWNKPKWKLEITKELAYNKNQKATIQFEVEELKKFNMPYLKTGTFPKQVSYAYRLPTEIKLSRPKNPVIVQFEKEENSAIAKPNKDTVKKIVTPPKAIDNNTEHYTETVESNETKVLVYFVDKNGTKYPRATPEIVFNDIQSSKRVASFKRMVSGGEPLPQIVPAGKYNVVVEGYNNLYVRNVNIQENKINKVYIKVTKGTLSFAYVGNRTRPVEFNAIVNRRFEQGATVIQKCVDVLEYEPGTYYVEIKTMPATKFSIDMSFGAYYELQIHEPGFLQITNTEMVGKINLQQVDGDMFMNFHQMNITGNLESQKLELQPGLYKIIYPADPRFPQAGTREVKFNILSNKATLVKLGE